MTEKIRQLIESPVAEDVAIGFKLLLSEKKFKKKYDLRRFIEDNNLKANVKDADIYIGRFNIWIPEGRYFIIHWHTHQPSTGKDVKIIRL